jgi:hypothetical protein
MKDKQLGFIIFISSIMVHIVLNLVVVLNMGLYHVVQTMMKFLVYFGGILLFIYLAKLGYIMWKKED